MKVWEALEKLRAQDFDDVVMIEVRFKERGSVRKELREVSHVEARWTGGTINNRGRSFELL